MFFNFPIAPGHVHRVQLEKGFSEEQAMQALAAWTHKKPEDLPDNLITAL